MATPCSSLSRRRCPGLAMILFFALLFVAFAIAGATAFVIFWPLTLVHIRDRHPALQDELGRVRSRIRPHWVGCCVGATAPPTTATSTGWRRRRSFRW